MRARSIMILGTSSHVGKSLITAALCRIFAQRGYRVAPFKSQNMSLNSAATIEGLEIGRAQALQAEAAGQAASVHMNPVLLKPCGEMQSQVVVRGKIWGRLTASEYHRRRVEELLPTIRESFEILASSNDIIVLEGAGSPAEINLKQHDIVNMRMAEMADAACILVGDIDRGGVFASLLGTVALLEKEEQARIKGLLINKFRGDRSLLQPGVAMIEDRLGVPCVGVVPFLPGLLLEQEDSMGLTEVHNSSGAWGTGDRATRPLRIAVVALPSFSNFTDFDALGNEPSVDLRFVRDAKSLALADVVVLPGSKQTADDLRWLRGTDLDRTITAYARNGLVVGICGGMQMLGHEIADSAGVEATGTISGLGLLPLRTQMLAVKTTRLVTGTTRLRRLFEQAVPPLPVSGYEIHVGETRASREVDGFAILRDETNGMSCLDGCVSANTRIFGTYLHGLFDEDGFRHAFIGAARAFHHLAPPSALQNWKAQRQLSLDRLADAVRASVDLTQIFGWVGLHYRQDDLSQGEER